MIYRRYRPAAPLSDFVELLWYWEGEPEAHVRERVLPDGAVGLIVNLAGDPFEVYDPAGRPSETFRGPIVTGAHSEHVVIPTASKRCVAGAIFRPGGAYPFLGMPAVELRNSHVSLDRIWRAEAELLRERMLEAATPDAKLRAMETCLLECAIRPLERNAAVRFAVEQFHSYPRRSVADVTSRIGLSSRRFIEIFSREVGLTPKLFCRVRRFQKLLRNIASTAEVDWTEAALDCEYFDQVHFIHDFRAFSGLSPSAYLLHRTDQVNHVPLET